MKTALFTLPLVLSLLVVCPLQAQLGVTHLNSTTSNRRVALVVGNTAYQHIAPLKNSLNDASAMTQALKSLQFEVTTLTNVTYPEFMTGFAAFSKKLRTADVALIYFSVHGGNYQGHYYLFPTDAKVDCDLKNSCIDLSNILDKLNEHPVQNSFVLLDAGNSTVELNQCPDAIHQSTLPTIPKGSMIVYAAEPGKQAGEDSIRRNSMFTSELLKHLTTPSLGIRTIIDRTTIGVRAQTNGKQSPVRYDNLTSDFTFSRITTQPDSSGVNQSNITTKPSIGIHSLPLQVDLSPFIPPLIDQGKVPYDAAWVTAYYAYTTHYAAQHNIIDPAQLRQIALSPMLPYKQLRPNCDRGIGLADIATYIIENGDVAFEEYSNTSCDSAPSAELLAKARQNRPIKDVIKIFGPGNTKREKVFFTQQQLGEYKTPVIVGIQVSERLQKLTASDEYYQPGGNNVGLHAVTVVGYDRASFKILNTWGPKWGRNGYFRMKFDDFATAAVGGLVLVLPDELSFDAQKK